MNNIISRLLFSTLGFNLAACGSPSNDDRTPARADTVKVSEPEERCEPSSYESPLKEDPYPLDSDSTSCSVGNQNDADPLP